MTRRPSSWLVAGLVVAGLSLTGCSSPPAAATDEGGPAKVVPIAGTDRSRVELTAEGAKRVGIVTEPVRGSAAGAAQQSVIPLAAVLYDKNGTAWTYTTPMELTYVPVKVVIGRVQGDTAILSSGPAPGTKVVTVGGAELLGAEFGVSE